MVGTAFADESFCHEQGSDLASRVFGQHEFLEGDERIVDLRHEAHGSEWIRFAEQGDPYGEFREVVGRASLEGDVVEGVAVFWSAGGENRDGTCFGGCRLDRYLRDTDVGCTTRPGDARLGKLAVTVVRAALFEARSDGVIPDLRSDSDLGWQSGPSMTSFRQSPSFKPDRTATTVWLRAGQRAASRVKTEAYDQQALQQAALNLRALTRLAPAVALPKAQAILASAGVALVFVAEYEKCRASGATWWASPTKAVILLSNRGKHDDRFWFSLFHEIGHLLHHAKRDTFIDSNGAEGGAPGEDGPPWTDPPPVSGFIDDGSRDSAIEREADDYASDTLIPPEFRSAVLAISSDSQLEALSKRIGIGAGIVAGRHQYETGNYKRFNDYRLTVPHELFVNAP